jgi:hypothetical protein
MPLFGSFANARHEMRRQSLLLTCSLVAGVACAAPREAPSGPTAPTLASIDSTQIWETEQSFIGKPNAIALGPDGTVFISDVAERRVVRVDRDGGRFTVVAAKGGGPGEVAGATSLAVVGDTLLVIKNAARGQLEYFALPSLTYRGSVRIDFPSTSLSSGGGVLLIGSLMADSGHAFAVIIDSLSPPRRGGTVPAIYRRLPPVTQAFGGIELARDDSTVIGVFEASNTLYRWSLGNTPTDSVVLTPTTRRGARTPVMEELVRDPSKAESLAYQWSFPLLVAPLSAQRTAVVFFDPTLKNGQFTGPSYLLIVDWQRHTSCRDVTLPVPADVPPRFAIRGDTLTAVVQHPKGKDGITTWIVRWRIGAARC